MIGDTIYAWQVLEQPDVWSMVGAFIPGLDTHSPLMSRDYTTVQRMRPYAEQHSRQTHQPLRLAMFTLTEVIEGNR